MGVLELGCSVPHSFVAGAATCQRAVMSGVHMHSVPCCLVLNEEVLQMEHPFSSFDVLLASLHAVYTFLELQAQYGCWHFRMRSEIKHDQLYCERCLVY
jgi:hypothetical protein